MLFLSCEDCILIWEDFATRKKISEILNNKEGLFLVQCKSFWVRIVGEGGTFVQMRGIKLSFLSQNLIKWVQDFGEVFFSGKTYLVWIMLAIGKKKHINWAVASLLWFSLVAESVTQGNDTTVRCMAKFAVPCDNSVTSPELASMLLKPSCLTL